MKTPQWTTGWKNGQTLFHRTLPAAASGPTNTTAVDWHLKVKDIKCNVGLTKNYCLTVSMQKNQLNSKTHSLDTAGSHELNGHFLPCPSKNH